MDSSTASTEPSQLAAALVLTNRSLLQLVAQFQRGMPLFLHELHANYVSRLPARGERTSNRNLWRAVMKQCNLDEVQKIFSLSQRPEFTGIELLKIEHVAISAVEFDRRVVLKWLHEEVDGGARLWNAGVAHAVYWGRKWETLLWLMKHRYEDIKSEMTNVYSTIAHQNRLVLLKELIALRPESLTTAAMDEMARSGSLEFVKYLHEHTSGLFSYIAMDNAARVAHYDVVLFLHENRSEGCSSTTMDCVAKHGQLELLKRLLSERTVGCTFVAMDKAATCGHLDVVRWLHENRTEGCSSVALNGAARYGHFEIVKFLVENRTEGAIDCALGYAAESRNLEMAKYLHSKLEGSRRDRISAALAMDALNGKDLEIIRYVHEDMGEPFNDECLKIAMKNGDPEVIDYVAARLQTKTA